MSHQIPSLNVNIYLFNINYKSSDVDCKPSNIVIEC